MKRRNIVLIGAGSVKFTQGLVADLILSGKPWALRLVDIDERALATADGLSRRMAEARNADITVASSTDRVDMLPGADVIAVTIGVGGRRAWEADVFIPRKYGIFQPIGDTAMAGGISRALRMVPAMVDIASDVQRLAPEAMFFNYANPMTVNCWAVRKATGANMVGLCIGVQHIYQQLARILGVPEQEVTGLAAGLNHYTWIYDLRWKGEDAWPLLREKLAANPAAGGRLCGWLFERYGAFPAVGDGHVMEFMPERFRSGDCMGNPLGTNGHFEHIISTDDANFAGMQAIAEGKAPLDDKIFDRTTWEHSQLLEMLTSMDLDRRQTFTANLPNQGAVANLPEDVVLELTVAATGRGLRALQVPDFPGTLAALLLRKIASASLTVEAALTGERGLFVEALLVDGCIDDPVMAGKLADELLASQAKYLPRYA
ncbi:MAG: family 4 glycosyl hydrolase [Anaerolineae bacterium]